MTKKKKKRDKTQKGEEILYIRGMHCASCEVLIEKKLLQQDGVKYADASLRNNAVFIKYEEGKKPDRAALNKELSKHGYTLSHQKVQQEKKKNTKAIILAGLGVLVLFFIFERLQFGQYVSVDANSSLPAFLLLGIVAGISSCAALIGGLLLFMTKQWNEAFIDVDSKKEKAKPHIMFHVGRLASFIVFGGVLGLLGQAISLNNATFFSILTILVSAMMLVLALQMLEVQWAQKIKFTAPKFVTRYASDEKNFAGKYMPFLTGALTFLLPCGFTLIAQTIALTSGSFVQGALIMLAFALGTMPVLIGISWGGLALNTKPHRTALFNKVAGIVIVFFVMYNVNGQLNVLDLPSLSDVFASAQEGQQEITEESAGEQVINITADGFAYTPTGTTTIKAGEPATLIMYI